MLRFKTCCRNWHSGTDELVKSRRHIIRAKVLYPNKDYHINPAIPDLLRKALFEAILCLRAAAYTSTVIMCRRTLEGFVVVQGVNKTNLKKAILELSWKEIINKQLCALADELRISGYEAAHDIEIEFSTDDARDIVDFTIVILDFTYSFKIKFEAFKSRKEKQRVNKKTIN